MALKLALFNLKEEMQEITPPQPEEGKSDHVMQISAEEMKRYRDMHEAIKLEKAETIKRIDDLLADVKALSKTHEGGIEVQGESQKRYHEIKFSGKDTFTLGGVVFESVISFKVKNKLNGDKEIGEIKVAIVGRELKEDEIAVIGRVDADGVGTKILEDGSLFLVNPDHQALNKAISDIVFGVNQ